MTPHKTILILGATGMVGNAILTQCLDRPDVREVRVITRRPMALSHPKLVQKAQDNFLDFSGSKALLQGVDYCFYCVGVYTGQFPPETFREITVDYLNALVAALKDESPRVSFCLLSAQGADVKETSRIMFARDKGAAENGVKNAQFDRAYFFRPGYIYPSVERKEPTLLYRFMRRIYPLIGWEPHLSVTSAHLAKTMIDVTFSNAQTAVFENYTIRRYIGVGSPLSV